MEQKGTCLTCSHSYTNDWGLLYCSHCTEDRRVSPKATCNHWTPRLTNDGYTGKCFLTSACVSYLGKPDDCYELTVLRSFRDGYLSESDEGKELIKEYYAIAPSIVEKINSSQQKEALYAYIYENIKNCIFFIENGENENALERYKNMVLYLKEIN